MAEAATICGRMSSGYIDCYFRLAAGNHKYHGVKQNRKVALKYMEYAREEIDLSKNT